METQQLKHTPGPWMTKEGQIYGTDGKTLALIPYFDEENEKDTANAEVIAAAPELAQTLNELIYQLTGEQEDERELIKILGLTLYVRIKQGKNALKKAGY